MPWAAVVIGQTNPETRLLIESQGEATAEQVDVVVCVDTGTTAETVDAETGDPYDDGTEATKELHFYPMHHLDGAWMVKNRDVTILESWNQAPCDGAWES